MPADLLELNARTADKSLMANSSQAADRFNLDRFVKAQAEVYARALAELRQGSKRSHWMWFIFPQVNGLGYSSTARFYAITSKEEASAYLNHAVLGKRLLECSEALLAINGKSAEEIFGYPDDLKLRSSMTLFSRVSQPGSVFARVLEQYYASQPDGKTLELLQQAAKS